MTHLTTPNTDIIIVGAGLVGLSFALMLARHGIHSTLIEKNLHLQDTRNTALSRKSVQIYQAFRLWECIADFACPVVGVDIYEHGGFGRAKLRAFDEGFADFGAVVQNHALLDALYQAVADSPFINMHKGYCLVDMHQNDAMVHAQFASDAGSTSTHSINAHRIDISAKILVACDGAYSSARTLLNIGTDTHDYQQSAIVGMVTTAQAHNGMAIECFDKLGPVALLPLSHSAHTRSLVWVCKRGDEQAFLHDKDKLLTTLTGVFDGVDIGNIIRIGAYPLTKIIAHRQVIGRVVLLGNAAHTLHPVAGQGFNLCLRDCALLADTLASVNLHDNATIHTALERYTQMRLQDQRRVARFCDFIIWGFCHKNPVIKFARNVGLILFDKVPFIKPMLARYAMGLARISDARGK